MIAALDTIRDLLSLPDAALGMRVVLLVCAIGAAVVWTRGRTGLAAFLVLIGTLVAGGFWTLQIMSPLGLDAGGSRSRAWAQAGVIVAAPQRGDGFVIGTPLESSIPASLARRGVPLAVIFSLPQLALLALMLGMATLPRLFFRSRATAAFAVAVTLGGGLWPGVSPYPVLLARPRLLVVFFGGVLAGLVLLRVARVRAFLGGRRLTLAFALMGAAAMTRAAEGGAESGAEGFLFVASSLLLASPLRAIVRRTCPSRPVASRMEALVILCAFIGGGLFWWNPAETNPDFEAARDKGHALRGPLEWIARNVPVDDVVIAAPGYGAHIAALSGRRVLFEPSPTSGLERLFEQPGRREYLLVTALEGYPKERLANAFSGRFLLTGPGELRLQPRPPENAIEDPVLTLEPVYADANDFHVFRLVKK